MDDLSVGVRFRLLRKLKQSSTVPVKTGLNRTWSKVLLLNRKARNRVLRCSVEARFDRDDRSVDDRRVGIKFDNPWHWRLERTRQYLLERTRQYLPTHSSKRASQSS